MKILYINPVFLDYRIPYFKRLNELFSGKFHVIYSSNRYKGFADHLLEIIPSTLGDNAHPFKRELLYDTHRRSFRQFDLERGKRIPLTFGLLFEFFRIKPKVMISEGFFQWTPLAVLYSFIFRIPLFIAYERTLHTERNTGKLLTFYRKIIDLFVTGYLVNGSNTQEYLRSIGVSLKKIHCIGMSADGTLLKKQINSLSSFEKEEFRKKINPNPSGLTYLFSGRITRLKGVDRLIRAWEQHITKYPYDVLVLIGDESKADFSFRELLSRFPSIKSFGKIKYNEVYTYLAAADVFILPTLIDNWSLVIPEAMACGLPVATSIYNGCVPELVRTGINGISFDSLNLSSIINSLDYFHHVDLQKMGVNSLKIEQEFNTDNCAARAYNVINQYLI